MPQIYSAKAQRFSPPGSAPVPPRPGIRATDILRESSALLASRLRTSTSTTRNPCHRYTPRKLSASRLPAPHQSLPDQESVPQIYSVKAQRFSPPDFAPVPPRRGIRATDILRESSALLASRLRTSPSPTRNPCHRYTPRKLSASRLPAPHQSLPDQESVPQIYSAKAQRFSPPGSAPVPPRPGIRATDILRESSALLASRLRTSPSPTRNPCHRYTPRKLSASRLPAPHQSLPDQESVPQIYSVKAQRFSPPDFAPVPPRRGIRATDILRESSALLASRLRTSPSPTRNPCHRYTPRKLSASRLPAPHQSLPDQESVPQIYSAKAQRFSPPGSAPVPPRPGIRATDILRESSALLASRLRTSTSTTRNPCHRYTPRKLSASRLPAPHQSLPDQESVPQIYSAKAQRFSPPGSAPVPPRPGIRATDILRESSALLASRLRTSPSPTRNPCHRYSPRKLSASRLPAPHQSLPDQESVPQIFSAKAQRFSPPGSAPVPPRPGIRATDILRESSALLASRLRTSTSTTRNPCHRYTPRKLSASRLPAPHQSLPDQESVPQIYSAKAQRFSPPGSAPVPPRPGIRATDILRESSALLASRLRTSPSPTRNPCHRYSPRKLSASRLPAPHQSLPDQESVPQIYSAKAQRFSPPGSAPVPPRPGIRATDILRESSALLASRLRTSTSTTRNPCHRYTPRKLSASRLPAPHQSLPDQESVPQIYSVKAQRFSPPDFAPVPPRRGIRATDILRESSALLASRLRTSPSPTRNPCHRYTPRKLSASRLPAPHQSLPDQESVPQIYSAKAQRFSPPGSAPVPPRPGIRATDILRESSALLASRLRTSTSMTRNPCHRYTPRKLSASRLPAPHQSLPDQESVPQIYSAKAQRFSPPGSAPVPPRPGIRATDILRESSALLASRLRTSPSPTRNPCHRYTPRKLSAPRLPAPHQSLPDPESVPQIYSAKAQRFSPPGSAPVPPRPEIRATDILRESSALRATHRPVFRVFPLKREEPVKLKTEFLLKSRFLRKQGRVKRWG